MDAMHARQALGLAAISLSTLAIGCSGGNPMGWITGRPDTPTESAELPPPTPPTVTPQPSDTPSPDALAAKVTTFRNDVEPQLHAPAPAAAPATQPAIALATTRPSWLDAPSLQLTPYVQEPPAPAPAIASPSSASPASVVTATHDANLPITLPESADLQDAARQASAGGASMVTADQAEHKLAQHLREYPKDLEGQLNYEMLLFAEGQPVPQMSALAGLSSEDRELLSTVMDGLSNFRGVVAADDNLLLAGKIKPLLEMDDRLRSQAELTLPTVALCTQVESFGVYKPFDTSRFIAGQDNKVIVYVEVQNFASQLTPDNQWQTRLGEQMVLYTETGLPVWPAKSEMDPVVDVCRERRHDFFLRKLIALPKNLTIGRYLLKVTVTDQQANHVAETTTPIEIVAE
jgi:hypothetical protein